MPVAPRITLVAPALLRSQPFWRKLAGLLATGLTTLAAHAQAPPANDDCAGALALPVATACTAPMVVVNTYATATTGLPDPTCADYQGGDLWYTVTVPANGVVMLETSAIMDSYAYNTGLAVYSGSCGSLTVLTCDDNSSGQGSSYVRLTGRPAGEVLYVRAWTNSNTLGSFALCATTDDALPTTTWTGAASADWFAAANWSAGVPTAATNAYVPGGAPNYPSLTTAGLTASVHTLSIDKFAGFTFRAGTLAVTGSLRNREPFARFLDNTNTPYSGGEVQLTGTAPQQLSGISELFDLRVASSSTVLLTTQLRLDHFLTLAGGVLNTGLTWVELYNDNPFGGEFFSNARLVGETETSYLLGRIQTRRFVDDTTGPDDFGGLGFTLSSASTSTGNVPGLTRLNRYTGPARPGLDGRPGIWRSYVAEPGTDTDLNLTLDLHYFAHERNGLADGNLAAFSSPLTGGMGDAALPTGPWTQETGGTRLAPVAPDSASTFRLTGLTHLSAWTLGAAAPLPVTLTSFTAEAAGPDALLRWATASELNNAYFDVQASADGQAFATIGRVSGHGTSPQAHTYSLREANGRQAGGPRYYRLRQVDTDGTSSYSPVRTLAGAATGAAAARPTAFPNPYDQRLTVRVLALAAGPVQLTLHDALGRELLRHTALLPAAGPADLLLPGAAQLPPGLYLLGVALPGQPATQLRVSRQ